jgi:hypothetical protein
MANVRISISPSSTSLSYVVIFQLHLYMVYVYIAAYSICKSLLNIRSLSDVKDALDDMNAINQHSVHMHLFGL